MAGMGFFRSYIEYILRLARRNFAQVPLESLTRVYLQCALDQDFREISVYTTPNWQLR